MVDLPQNKTRDRIMDVAETLFMTRGYSAVKLRDIAEAVDMRHASLYYYVPKGKEQLFVAVIERSLDRHEREMRRLISEAGETIQAKTFAVSDWLVSQPPIDLVRMFESDLKQIDESKAAELQHKLLHSLNGPYIEALEGAKRAGEIDVEESSMAAMSLLTLIQSVHHIPLDSIPEGRKAFGRRVAQMLLFGLLKR